MPIIRFLLRILYAPFMLLGFAGLALWLIGAGWSFWTLLPLFLIAIAFSFIIEQIIPYREEWNRSHGDGARDAWHAFVNESANATSILILPVAVALVPWIGIWPTGWPLWAQLLAAIIVADFGITLAHYYSHKWSALWRLHAVHHSVKRMYGFNGLMKHPLHQAIELLVGTAPLVLAGIPQNVAFLLGFMVAIQLLLQHSNADLRIGPLRYILALSPVHRFHHLKWAAEGDVNFGLFTTLWDRMLGTAFYDGARRFASSDLGIGAQPDYPIAYGRQLLQPFLRQPREEA